MDAVACNARDEADGNVRALVELATKKKRIRAERFIRDTSGNTIARVEISIVMHAKPSPHEYTHVWRTKCPPYIDGIFVRSFFVGRKFRRLGYGTMLMNAVKDLSDKLVKRVYIDTEAENVAMRAFVRKLGARENMFWHTPRGLLMVRYIWI